MKEFNITTLCSEVSWTLHHYSSKVYNISGFCLSPRYVHMKKLWRDNPAESAEFWAIGGPIGTTEPNIKQLKNHLSHMEILWLNIDYILSDEATVWVLLRCNKQSKFERKESERRRPCRYWTTNVSGTTSYVSNHKKTS